MQFEAETIDRLKNGAKRRNDSRGDAWANSHRDELGAGFNMTDVDGLIGSFSFAANTGDRLFLEYVPDHYSNRNNKVRNFGVVAVFDRKSTESAAMDSRNAVCNAMYMWLCRLVGAHQEIMPKFFYVIGGQSPPWTLIEMNPETGERVQECVLESMNWRAVWETFGLAALREELKSRISRFK